MNKLRCALVIPDCHRPFHSRRAYALMLEVAAFVNPDEIVLQGDYADFYSVSRHLKDPRVATLLQQEIDSVNQGLDELDKYFPTAKKVYIEGNHEARLEKYLVEKAPGVFGVTECRELFGVTRRPLWSYHEFGRAQSYRILNSDLYVRHRPLSNNPIGGLRKALVSYCYVDIHKIEEAQIVGLDGKTRIAFCPGWLGDVRHRVFDYMPSTPQWQWGFALVTVEGTQKTFHHDIIQIKDNHTCVFRGKVFKA